jgi:hypothetical protein
MIQMYTRKKIRNLLMRAAPPEQMTSLYEELASMGFEMGGTWVINPYWSTCGSFPVDPVVHYGQAFLSSPMSAFLGVTKIDIDPVSDMMDIDRRRAYDSALMKKVRETGFGTVVMNP